MFWAKPKHLRDGTYANTISLMLSQYLAYRLGRASRPKPKRDLRRDPITVDEVETWRKLLLYVGVPVLIVLIVCIL